MDNIGGGDGDDDGDDDDGTEADADTDMLYAVVNRCVYYTSERVWFYSSEVRSIA